MKLMQASEPTASRRRVYFFAVEDDWVTPAVGLDGEQPEISVDGGGYTATGIGPLVEVSGGEGDYYAELTQGVLALGRHIETRVHIAGSTARCPGDSVLVVAYDPYTMDGPLAAEAAGRPATRHSMQRRRYEWIENKRTRDRSTGTVTLYGADGITALETLTQSTAGTVDTEQP